METLSFEQMENVQGGAACSSGTNKAIAWISALCLVGSCTGIGALICAPTAVGMAVAGLVCAYK